MLLKQFVFNSFGVNGFVLGGDSGEAILIDPSASNSLERDALADYIETKGLKVRHLLNTHLHLDHLLGLGMKKTESMGWKALKNHLCHTYMSFILSELTDEEMSNYILD